MKYLNILKEYLQYAGDDPVLITMAAYKLGAGWRYCDILDQDPSQPKIWVSGFGTVCLIDKANFAELLLRTDRVALILRYREEKVFPVTTTHSFNLYHQYILGG